MAFSQNRFIFPAFIQQVNLKVLQMADKKTKKILIVFTGGTFSMKIDQKSGGVSPYFSGNELIQMIPEAFKLAEIETYDFGKYPGPHVTPELMLQLSKKIREFLSTGKYDGV